MSSVADPRAWGPSFWNMLFSIAATYDPKKVNNQKVKEWIYGLRFVLPCDECKIHFNQLIREKKIDDYLVSNHTLFDWVYWLKVQIDISNGKPTKDIKSIEDYKFQYELTTNKSEQPVKNNNPTNSKSVIKMNFTPPPVETMKKITPLPTMLRNKQNTIPAIINSGTNSNNIRQRKAIVKEKNENNNNLIINNSRVVDSTIIKDNSIDNRAVKRRLPRTKSQAPVIKEPRNPAEKEAMRRMLSKVYKPGSNLTRVAQAQNLRPCTACAKNRRF